jgi:hypothetical protein
MALGIVVGALWVGLVLLLSDRGVELYGPGLGVPLLPVLIGLIEVVSGKRFGQLAQSWDELAGWQRFLLGLFIAALAIAVIGGGIGVVLALTIE